LELLADEIAVDHHAIGSRARPDGELISGHILSQISGIGPGSVLVTYYDENGDSWGSFSANFNQNDQSVDVQTTAPDLGSKPSQNVDFSIYAQGRGSSGSGRGDPDEVTVVVFTQSS
jgi:hypothetical protein